MLPWNLPAYVKSIFTNCRNMSEIGLDNKLEKWRLIRFPIVLCLSDNCSLTWGALPPCPALLADARWWVGDATSVLRMNTLTDICNVSTGENVWNVLEWMLLIKRIFRFTSASFFKNQVFGVAGVVMVGRAPARVVLGVTVGRALFMAHTTFKSYNVPQLKTK